MFRNAPFYLIALLAIIVAGFWPSYFAAPSGDIRASLHVHGISMLLWLLMLIAQSWLIRARRNQWHKMLGKVSFVLIPIIAISGVLVTFEDYAHNYPDPTAPGAYGLFFVGFWFVAMIVYFYSMAIYNRKNVQLHARYMLSTAVALIIPGFFRLYARLTQPEDFLVAFFEVMAAVSIVPIALLVSDKLKGRIYSPFVQLVVAWGTVLIAYKFIHLLGPWRSFAAWSLEQGF